MMMWFFGQALPSSCFHMSLGLCDHINCTVLKKQGVECDSAGASASASSEGLLGELPARQVVLKSRQGDWLKKWELSQVTNGAWIKKSSWPFCQVFFCRLWFSVSLWLWPLEQQFLFKFNVCDCPAMQRSTKSEPKRKYQQKCFSCCRFFASLLTGQWINNVSFLFAFFFDGPGTKFGKQLKLKRT